MSSQQESTKSVGALLATNFNLQYISTWKFISDEEKNLWKTWVSCFYVDEEDRKSKKTSLDVLVYWKFMEKHFGPLKSDPKPRWNSSKWDSLLVESFNRHYFPSMLTYHELLLWERFDSERLSPYLLKMKNSNKKEKGEEEEEEETEKKDNEEEETEKQKQKDWTHLSGPISLSIYKEKTNKNHKLYVFGDVHYMQKQSCPSDVQESSIHISNWLLQKLQQNTKSQLFLETKVIQPGDEKQTFEGKSPDGHLFGTTAALFRNELQEIKASTKHRIHRIDVRHMEWFRLLKRYQVSKAVYKLQHLVENEEYFSHSDKWDYIPWKDRRNWIIALLLFFQGHTILNHIEQHIPKSWSLMQTKQMFNRLFSSNGQFHAFFMDLMYVLTNLLKIDKQIQSIPFVESIHFSWKEFLLDEMDFAINNMFDALSTRKNPFSIFQHYVEKGGSLDFCSSSSSSGGVSNTNIKKKAECAIYQWHLIIVDLYFFARWLRYKNKFQQTFVYTGEYHSNRYRDWISQSNDWKLVFEQKESTTSKSKAQCVAL
jgi:hypothetical protein